MIIILGSSKSFEPKKKNYQEVHQTIIIYQGRAEVVVPLKYLSNFWRSLDLPLINCEIELDLTPSKYCVIFDVSRTFREVDINADPVVYTNK